MSERAIRPRDIQTMKSCSALICDWQDFSLNEISKKMEIPKRTVRDFFAGRIRGKHPVKFVKAMINE